MNISSVWPDTKVWLRLPDGREVLATLRRITARFVTACYLDDQDVEQTVKLNVVLSRVAELRPYTPELDALQAEGLRIRRKARQLAEAERRAANFIPPELLGRRDDADDGDSATGVHWGNV